MESLDLADGSHYIPQLFRTVILVEEQVEGSVAAGDRVRRLRASSQMRSYVGPFPNDVIVVWIEPNTLGCYRFGELSHRAGYLLMCHKNRKKERCVILRNRRGGADRRLPSKCVAQS